MKGLGILQKAGIALTASLLLASVFLGVKLLFPSGDGYRKAALDNGQRIEFSLLTGKVDGKLLTLEELKAALPDTPPAETETPAEPPETADKTEGTDEDAPAASPAGTEASGAEEPAGSEAETDATAPPDQPAEPETPALPVPVPPLAPVERQLPSGQIIPAPHGDETAYTYFAKRDTPRVPSQTSQIAVIVGNLGISPHLTEAALALPANVTLSFSPYGKETAAWAQAARSVGHEILLDLPTQTNRYPAVDPGPYGLLLNQEADEAAKRFVDALSSARGYIGLTLPYNDSLSNNETAILAALARFRAHGLLMINTYPQPTEAMFRASHKTGVPILHTNIIIDRHLDDTSIKNQLARAEDLSRQYGQLLVITQASPIAIGLLDSWLETLAQKRVAIVPVSALLPEPAPKPAPDPTPNPTPAPVPSSETPTDPAPADTPQPSAEAPQVPQAPAIVPSPLTETPQQPAPATPPAATTPAKTTPADAAPVITAPATNITPSQAAPAIPTPSVPAAP